MEELSIDELKKIELALNHKTNSMNENLANGRIHRGNQESYSNSRKELCKLRNKVRKIWQSKLPKGRIQ